MVALKLFHPRLTNLAMPDVTDTIHFQVNGQPQSCAPQTRLPDLLTQLGFNPRLIAIEYNGEILHRQFWQETYLQAGDHLEIVTIVGGG